MINLNERAVAELLEQLIAEGAPFCTCENCLTDIMVIALNNLAPRYVADSATVHFFSPSRSQDAGAMEETRREVFKAIKVVSDNPRH